MKQLALKLVDVILLFLVSLLLYIVDHVASYTPAHFSEVLHLVALCTFFSHTLSIIWVGGLNCSICIFLHGHFNSCMQSHFILFTSSCMYFIKIFYVTKTFYNCYMSSLGLNSFCSQCYLFASYQYIFISFS